MRMPRARTLFAFVLVASIAACADAPTVATPAGGPTRNGHTLGSGHIVAPDPTDVSAVAPPMETTADDTTSTDLNGHTLGSGH